MRNPNGYGTITKLKGHRRRPYWVRYACSYSTDGLRLKENRKTIGYYPTRQEAIIALAEFNRTPYDLDRQTTFGEIYEKWIAEKKISGKTELCYLEAFRKCTEIHARPISELRLQHLQQIVDRYSETSRANVRNIITVMKGIYRYALRYELIAKDYSQFVVARYVDDKEIHKAFTEDDIKLFWGMPRSEFRDLTLILLYSGWRISEMLDLDEVNTAENYMRGGKKTKAGKDRIVPTHHLIQPLVNDYAEGFDITYGQYKKQLKEYGYLPHDTRHTFISRLQSAGADHVSIERLVGHISKTVTDKVYTHKTIEELRKAVELLT